MLSRLGPLTILCVLTLASVTKAQDSDVEVTPAEGSASESPVLESEPSAPAGETSAPELASEPLPDASTGDVAEEALPEPDEVPSSEPVVELEWGRGLTVRSEDDAFSLTIRGRVQAQGAVWVTPETAGNPDSEESVEFLVRRARLQLNGTLFSSDFQYYFQLGFAPLDMEPDILIPLRDAALTWTGIPNLAIRVGQMKVPFNRERVISSSQQQLVDRSPVNAELTLDRDIGIQIFGEDLFDLGGYLGYQIGVFQGDGRLRVNEGAGLLYVARLEIQPLPYADRDDAYVAVDLTREARPRLSIGIGGAFNHEARRTRSTQGDYYALGGFDYAHAELDFIFKFGGFSAMGELLYRQATGASVRTGTVDGVAVTDVASNGLGYFLQAGYLFEPMIEVSARYSEIIPVTGPDLPQTTITGLREITLGFGWYPLGHDLKLQFDWSHISVPEAPFEDGTHRFRLQMQAYF